MSRHTPGPWTMEKDGRIKALSRKDCQTIGIFSGTASTQQHVDEHPYNCTVITTSPDMLEALEKVHDESRIEYIDGDPVHVIPSKVMEFVNFVLTKAYGERVFKEPAKTVAEYKDS